MQSAANYCVVTPSVILLSHPAVVYVDQNVIVLLVLRVRRKLLPKYKCDKIIQFSFKTNSLYIIMNTTSDIVKVPQFRS